MIDSIIRSRRSIRKYLDKDVPVELIDKVLEAGRRAPSAKNRQPWKYIVFGNEKKGALVQCMERGLFREENGIPLLPKSRFGIPDAKNTLRIMNEAPVIIVVMNTNGMYPFSLIDGDERITEICDSLSIGASIENMLLMAQDLGLGALWIGNTCFAYTELMEYVASAGQLVGAIALGYADEQPVQRPRKNMNEIIEYRL